MGNSQSNSKKIYKQHEVISNKLHNIPEKLNYPDDVCEFYRKATPEQVREQIFNNQIKIIDLKQQEDNKHQAFTDVLWDLPLERANQLQLLIDQGQLKQEDYPLLGFVMSIKDSNKLKGTATTNGFLINVGKLELKNPESIKQLIRGGALLTCKGNIPQALFSMESFNNVFGETKNPYDHTRIAGGSSGGDAVLVKLGVVNAAMGSDVAGSLRIPALCCGITSFKPTCHRLSQDMKHGYFEKHQWAKKLPPRHGAIIQATVGPMARKVQTCETIMKLLTGNTCHDFEVPPLKWTPQQLPQKVGYLKPLAIAPLSPANNRAFEMSKNALQQSGIQLEEIDIDHLMEEIIIVAVACFQKNRQLLELFKKKVDIKEKLFNAFDNFTLAYSVPTFMLRSKAKSLQGTREGMFLKGFILSIDENSDFIKLRLHELYQKFRHIMKEKDVETLLVPGMITPPVKHFQTNNSNFQAVYCFLLNLFNMPCGALPITHVQENEQVYEDTYNDKYSKSLKENMQDTVGLPVGVQVAALPWKDELCMEVMKEIEKKINYTSRFDQLS